MLFSSLIFLIVFLPCVLLVYYGPLRKHRSAQNVFLLIASLFFYAWGEPWFCLIMILSIFGNYIFGLLVDRFRGGPGAKAVIAVMLVFNLTIIFIFKYLMFTLNTINAAAGTSIPVPQIALPIGISFFTFQAISYVIDVYREKGELQKNLLNVGLYIAFFPQLIAGPIVRYETVSDQIMNRKETLDGFSSGVCRFITGFCKKVILANNFALLADGIFNTASYGSVSVSYAWLGAVAYTFQIYFDFSGYSDMAIGLGKMFGFEFPENFNYPYISKSVSEFWRRWHISLGSWFRDYVYFPLGGSYVDSRFRVIFNIFVVWMLTGVWHGANWTFICWGIMYGVLISFEKLVSFEERKIPLIVKHFYTMLLVIIGWVFFRAATLSDGVDFLGCMFGLSSTSLTDAASISLIKENAVYLIAGAIFSCPVVQKLSQLFRRESAVSSVLYAGVMTAGFLIAVSFLVKGAYNPFIYFNF